jgi:hypothetical protein
VVTNDIDLARIRVVIDRFSLEEADDERQGEQDSKQGVS